MGRACRSRNVDCYRADDGTLPLHIAPLPRRLQHRAYSRGTYQFIAPADPYALSRRQHDPECGFKALGPVFRALRGKIGASAHAQQSAHVTATGWNAGTHTGGVK